MLSRESPRFSAGLSAPVSCVHALLRAIFPLLMIDFSVDRALSWELGESHERPVHDE